MPVTERWLEPSEVPILEPVLESNHWSSLNANTCRVRAAFDGSKLVGFLVLQQFPILGPMWIDPNYRGDGLPGRLALEMRDFLKDIEVRGFLVIAESEFTEIMCRHFGLKKVDSPVYML